MKITPFRRGALAAAGILALSACAGEPQPVGEAQQSLSVCPPKTIEGLDISAGQGVIDWVKLKASGRQFAFIKATQGDYYTSTRWTAQWSGAQAAGLLRSAYHFFNPTIDGVAQARHFLSVVGPLGPGDLPPMLDIECPTASTQAASQSNCEYAGNSGWAPASVINQRIKDWLVYVEQQTGMKPIIYSYNYWFSGAGVDTAPLHAYPLYISSPSTGACYQIGLGNDFTSALFWQWSTTATGVPGVTTTVDLDRYLGTLADLRKMAGLDLDGGSAGDAGRDGGDAGRDGGDGGAGDGGAMDGAGQGCACASAGHPPGGGAGGGALLGALGLWLLGRRRAR